MVLGRCVQHTILIFAFNFNYQKATLHCPLLFLCNAVCNILEWNINRSYVLSDQCDRIHILVSRAGFLFSRVPYCGNPYLIRMIKKVVREVEVLVIGAELGLGKLGLYTYIGTVASTSSHLSISLLFLSS